MSDSSNTVVPPVIMKRACARAHSIVNLKFTVLAKDISYSLAIPSIKFTKFLVLRPHCDLTLSATVLMDHTFATNLQR